MKLKVKNFIKSNPLYYKLWFYINKSRLSRQLKLPQKSDDYYFDGYPRNGNTYTRGLLNYILPNKMGAHHLHVVAGIRIAHSNQIDPIIIVIRNPKDAILSNLYRKMYHSDSYVINNKVKLILSDLIKEWLDYYYFVKEQNGIHLIFLEKLSRTKNLI